MREFTRSLDKGILMIDLTQWKFVKRDVMRSQTIGDWDVEKKEIVAWSGLDELTTLDVFLHEVVEMVLCTLQGVDDKMLLKYDQSHDFAKKVSDMVVSAAGKDPADHENSLGDIERRVPVEARE